MSTHEVIEAVRAERRRQIESEGWSPEHDDGHVNNELSRAAACYLEYYLSGPDAMVMDPDDDCPADWPWDPKWWKPKDPRRDLVRAAALLIAEIERLDRAASTDDAPA